MDCSRQQFQQIDGEHPARRQGPPLQHDSSAKVKKRPTKKYDVEYAGRMARPASVLVLVEGPRWVFGRSNLLPSSSVALNLNVEVEVHVAS